jgi:uncharacterized membrane protein
MGIADVIPGVSGGTIALIVGIYRELVRTISNFHLRWIAPLFRWLFKGQKPQDWRALQNQLQTLNLAFVIPLGLGILTALGVGSLFIPALIEQFPEQTRGLFFGLILASVWIPFRMLQESDSEPPIVAVVACILLFAGGGYFATKPGHQLRWAGDWHQTTSNGETLDDIAKRVPSALPTSRLYWSDKNRSFRETIEKQKPDMAARLTDLRPDEDMSLQALKKKRDKQLDIYNKLEVPKGVSVKIPQLSLWYIFIAGMIAICAMILPGISGSYLLLIFGCYFFILNTVKGFIVGMTEPTAVLMHATYVGTFGIGATVGLFSFARLLEYLLSKWPAITFAGLVGLMVGCLRGVWPFRTLEAGVPVNVMPEQLTGLVFSTVGCIITGILAVIALTVWGQKEKAEEPSHE